ncbi:MAG: glycosyl hydrolase family 18 protein [Enterococcaceae bacterium]|jgi:chitinase|nr:glycosyl hydrolase family 18 protein [Enterococcaceae bacterium]MCI1920015.1 glycosyl hydrolase family 18 protein [Enterococcaceae bacterium]
MKKTIGSKVATLLVCTTVLCSATLNTVQGVTAFAQETGEQAELEESRWPEWSELGRFGEQDTSRKQVKHDGSIWQAKWWITSEQNKEPGSEPDYTTGWEEVGDILRGGVVKMKAGIQANPLGSAQAAQASQANPDLSAEKAESTASTQTFDAGEWREWSELKEYGTSDTKGFQVKHHGAVYESLWWTNKAADVEPGSAPETTTGWKKVGTIDAQGKVQLDGQAKKNPLQVSMADPSTPYSRINAGKGKKWGEQVFSPYIDSGLWYSMEGHQGLYPLGKEQEKSKISYANIGFIVSDPKSPKTASFGGYYNVDGTGENGGIVAGFADQIRQFREKGGDIMPSFGGENGTPLHKAIEDENELANKYMEIVEKYGLTMIDFDIEGTHVRDKAAWQRNNRALKIMQDKLGDQAPKVWFTFPVLPTGLVGEGTDNDAYNVLKDAVSSGIAVQGVNVMTMCFGPAFVKTAGKDYYKFVIQASESLKKQIQTIYHESNTELSDQEAYQKIGLTPWIGKSTQANETFTQEDAKGLQKYAKEKNIAMLSFWSLNRDNNINEDLKNPGIEEKGAYEFSSILNPFNSEKVAKNDAAAEKTPETKQAEKTAEAAKTEKNTGQVTTTIKPDGFQSRVGITLSKKLFKSSKNIRVEVNGKYIYSTENGVNYYSNRKITGEQVFISATEKLNAGDKIKVSIRESSEPVKKAKVLQEITVTEDMLPAASAITPENTTADLAISKAIGGNQVSLKLTSDELASPWNYQVWHNGKYLFSTENGAHYYSYKKTSKDGKAAEIYDHLKIKAGDVFELTVRDSQNTPKKKKVLKKIVVTKKMVAAESTISLKNAKGLLSVTPQKNGKSRVNLKLDQKNYQSPIDFTVSVNGKYLFKMSQKKNYGATFSSAGGYNFYQDLQLTEGDQVKLVAKDHFNDKAADKVLQTIKVKKQEKKAAKNKDAKLAMDDTKNLIKGLDPSFMWSNDDGKSWNKGNQNQTFPGEQTVEVAKYDQKAFDSVPWSKKTFAGGSLVADKGALWTNSYWADASQQPGSAPMWKKVCDLPKVDYTFSFTKFDQAAALAFQKEQAQKVQNKKKVIGYFANWQGYKTDYEPKNPDYSMTEGILDGKGYDPIDIPFDKLTHVNYGFLVIDKTTGKLKSNDPWADFGGDGAKDYIRQVAKLAHQNNVSAMFSIGGWNNSVVDHGFDLVTQTPEKMDAFTTEAVQFMLKYDYDGLDIDWEYPDNAERQAKFTALIKQLREKLTKAGMQDDRYYQLSIAVTANHEKMPFIAPKEVNEAVDSFNVMTYDFHGGFDNQTGHNAALYPNKTDKNQKFNISAAMKEYETVYGLPKNKLMVGMSFYSRGFANVGKAGLNQKSSGAPYGGSWDDPAEKAGIKPWWQLKQYEKKAQADPNDQLVFQWDDEAKVPTIYDGAKKELYTYDNYRSIKEKADWTKQNEYGGAIIWELSYDTPNNAELTSLVHGVLDEK